MLKIVPGPTPLVISHKGLDTMRLNYRTYHKTTDRAEDCYEEKVMMRHYLPLFRFPNYLYLSVLQLHEIHVNLGHRSVEKEMKIIESEEVDDLPLDTRKEVKLIFKQCHACQVKQGRPRRFMFSTRDPIIRAFNNILQISIVKLVDENVLHTIDMVT